MFETILSVVLALAVVGGAVYVFRGAKATRHDVPDATPEGRDLLKRGTTKRDEP